MLAATVLLSSSASSQTVIRSILDLWDLWEGRGPAVGPFAWIGDITHDGISDFVVGQTLLDRQTGRVRVHSGKDAQVLYTYVGAGPSSYMGQAVAGPGDLDGDKIPDFLGSTDRPGLESFVWSGADGSELARIESFFDSASLGDPDGDGTVDFVTGAISFLGPGRVTVFEGRTLAERYRLTNPAGSLNYGAEVTSLGDLDGDGYCDFAVGAPGELYDFAAVLGEAFVYSGREGRLLYRLEGPGVQSMFGWFIAAPGDLTGDGIPDLAVAAPALDGPTFSRKGRISFYDGPTGAPLGNFEYTQVPIPVRRFVGGNLTAIGDLNGNGFGDLVCVFIAVWPNASGGLSHLLAIDGGTREPIYVVPHQYGTTCSGYGITVASAGDQNDDGFPDFSTSTACNATPTKSLLDIVSGAPLGVKALGKPCGDGGEPLPRIGVSGTARTGTTLTIYLSQIAPEQEALLLLGSSSTAWRGLSLPVALPRFGNCPLFIAPEQRVRAVPREVRPGEAVARVDFPIPNDPSLIGHATFAQWFVRGLAPRSKRPFPVHRAAMTRALEIVVQ
jgi:hypothetical protein